MSLRTLCTLSSRLKSSQEHGRFSETSRNDCLCSDAVVVRFLRDAPLAFLFSFSLFFLFSLMEPQSRRLPVALHHKYFKPNHHHHYHRRCPPRSSRLGQRLGLLSASSPGGRDAAATAVRCGRPQAVGSSLEASRENRCSKVCSRLLVFYFWLCRVMVSLQITSICF